MSSSLTSGALFDLRTSRKLGRVVKALALGASLERGTGSNPVACSLFRTRKDAGSNPALGVFVGKSVTRQLSEVGSEGD